jgi:CRP-like cAMP-binding protein
MLSKEQCADAGPHRMSSVLWDTFTGSAPYRSVFLRSLHPAFLGRMLWELVAATRSPVATPPERRLHMASGATGLVGKRYHDGDVIHRQDDRGDCMYVIMEGQVEILRREGHREFCLSTLGEGDFFGEMGLFQEEIRSTTARAAGEVVVFTLERKSLLRRIHEDPSLAFRIIERMSARIRDLEAALVRHATVPS